MVNHLVVYVKANLLPELIQKLDSKGWSVIDVEPSTHMNYLTFAVFLLELIAGVIVSIMDKWHTFSDSTIILIGIAAIGTLIASLGFRSTYQYTVICEYVGNDEYMDMTPFDDTDDVFKKNENYQAEEADDAE